MVFNIRLKSVKVYRAKKCIVLLWSTPKVPSVELWFTQISVWFPLEKLTYTSTKISRYGTFTYTSVFILIS